MTFFPFSLASTISSGVRTRTPTKPVYRLGIAIEKEWWADARLHIQYLCGCLRAWSYEACLSQMDATLRNAQKDQTTKMDCKWIEQVFRIYECVFKLQYFKTLFQTQTVAMATECCARCGKIQDSEMTFDWNVDVPVVGALVWMLKQSCFAVQKFKNVWLRSSVCETRKQFNWWVDRLA